LRAVNSWRLVTSLLSIYRNPGLESSLVYFKSIIHTFLVSENEYCRETALLFNSLRTLKNQWRDFLLFDVSSVPSFHLAVHFFHSNQEIAQVNGMKGMEPFRDCVCGCEKWLKPHADRENIKTSLDWSYCSETLELLLFLSGTTYDCCWLDW